MTDFLIDVANYAKSYQEGIATRAVSPSCEALERLATIQTSLPDGPCDPAEVIETLATLSDATMATTGPRFFGFVTGGVLPASLGASWLANTWDQNTMLADSSPLTSALEEVALQWLVELLGLPIGAGAGFVTGATMANFTCLVAARHAVLDHVGWNVEADGLFDAPPITIIIGDEAHSSLAKSLGMAGFGRNRSIRVPADAQGRIRTDALPTINGPTIVCLQAGNVNTGAFDPFEPLIAWAHAAGAWVHIDGAFGLWAAASPAYANLTYGYQEADSWATDAHKYLNTPYDSGLAFVRDPEILRASMTISSAYLLPSDRRDPSDFTPEMSRRSRGVEIWAALRSIGRNGVIDLVDHTCQLARQFADTLNAAGITILNDVVLNQVLVTFGDTQTTVRTIAAIQQEGTCWASSTVWHGITAMRISVSSWATTAADIERSAEAIIRIAQEQRYP